MKCKNSPRAAVLAFGFASAQHYILQHEKKNVWSPVINEPSLSLSLSLSLTYGCISFFYCRYLLE